jgi:hypothetical protein
LLIEASAHDAAEPHPGIDHLLDLFRRIDRAAHVHAAVAHRQRQTQDRAGAHNPFDFGSFAILAT